jgi:nicotinamide phosphoribosyltransferase
MCAGGVDNEFETYRRLIEDVYPSGIVSIVSDTWDLWHVLTDTVPKLKDNIMARDGKVVIRPDSGDPVDIVCGLDSRDIQVVEDAAAALYFEKDYCYCEKSKQYFRVIAHDTGGKPRYALKEIPEAAVKGVIELLWETFGGEVNEKGYKELDPHIGAIYGDAITLDRANRICERLAAKGFASTNIVFGIGSYTYQYNTRDTFGFALKSTHAVIDHVEHNIFKDPVTDDGTKKSQTGRVVVVEHNGKLHLIDGLGLAQEQSYSDINLLRPIFKDGRQYNIQTLQEIRERLAGYQEVPDVDIDSTAA